ncbi:MAG: hypothetical protein WB297_00865 [Actinomycetota bacterium]
MSSLAISDPHRFPIGTIPTLCADALRQAGRRHPWPPIAMARSGASAAG